MADDSVTAKQRQALYWWMLSQAFRTDPKTAARYAHLDAHALKLAEEAALHPEVVSPAFSIDAVLQRHPEVAKDLEEIARVNAPSEDHSEEDSEDESEESAATATAEAEDLLGTDPTEKGTLRRGLVFSKLLMNVFGPPSYSPSVSAQQLTDWTNDARHLERALGFAPGGIAPSQGQGAPGGFGGRGGGAGGGGGGGGAGASQHGHGGNGAVVTDQDLKRGLEGLQGELINRMAIHEVLKDPNLVAQIQPSLAIVEQILRAKHNLSPEALENARAIIRRYVDKLAEVFKTRVAKAMRGKPDRSTPPKRIFRNLDLKKTVWRNLTNWDNKERRLYVNQLYYKRTARKETPSRMIVLVDQSGSMVEAMVQSTILASIFAGLPRVEVHLMAFDTRVVDLTPWVADPLEVLLRTNLGGGTYINLAVIEAEKKIVEPKNTAFVLITDFYEGGSDQVLLDRIKALKDSGVNVIPCAGLSSSGYVMLHPWFKDRLKENGMPVLTGNIDKLIEKLRYLIG